MNSYLLHRRATLNDIRAIVSLLLEDELGKTREQLDSRIDQCYTDAFHRIDSDQNQYLMVVVMGGDIIGTCHLSIMPSLTFRGATRMQIEAVRVAEKYRGQGVGEWMMRAAIDYGKSKGASIIQLTTNKSRLKAKKFYETLGFESTHEGMKLKIEQLF